jgi:hypothetical protein
VYHDVFDLGKVFCYGLGRWAGNRLHRLKMISNEWYLFVGNTLRRSIRLCWAIYRVRINSPL